MSDTYDSPRFSSVHQTILPGNTLATLLLTPQAGTAAATKAHTTTLAPWYPQRAITLKKLAYTVVTAQTGTGNNLAIDVYNGTTSVGTLAVTTTAAGSVAESTADIDSNVGADGYVRLIAISTTTASDANSATGGLTLTYEERYS